MRSEQPRAGFARAVVHPVTGSSSAKPQMLIHFQEVTHERCNHLQACGLPRMFSGLDRSLVRRAAALFLFLSQYAPLGQRYGSDNREGTVMESLLTQREEMQALRLARSQPQSAGEFQEFLNEI